MGGFQKKAHAGIWGRAGSCTVRQRDRDALRVGIDLGASWVAADSEPPTVAVLYARQGVFLALARLTHERARVSRKMPTRPATPRNAYLGSRWLPSQPHGSPLRTLGGSRVRGSGEISRYRIAEENSEWMVSIVGWRSVNRRLATMSS